MIDSLVNSLTSEVFTPEGVTHSAMGMPHAQMVAHAYGHHAAPKRTWNELTLAEVKAAYDQYAKYQEEDMGISGWVDFAVAIEAKLKQKNT